MVCLKPTNKYLKFKSSEDDEYLHGCCWFENHLNKENFSVAIWPSKISRRNFIVNSYINIIVVNNASINNIINIIIVNNGSINSIISIVSLYIYIS